MPLILAHQDFLKPNFPTQRKSLIRGRNKGAVRANLVDRAEDWRWGSLFRWLSQPEPDPKLLTAWPITRLPNWAKRVNEPLSEKARLTN